MLSTLFSKSPAIVTDSLVDLRSLPILYLITWIAGLYAIIKFCIVIYRISPVHPLAKVPGPRFAAATRWFRTYHEVWPDGGGMIEELTRLHAKYGPVVRIGPNDVHFATPSAYLDIYSQTSRVVKDPFHYHCFNEDLSLFALCDPAAHKERREILNPFFSRRNILNMQYVIEDKICHLSHRLRSISQECVLQNPTGNVVDMFAATKSFTMDVIMEFCFAKTLGILRVPKFGHPLIHCGDKALTTFFVFKHFPVIKHIVLNIPDSVAVILMPNMSKGPLILKRTLERQVDEFLRDPEGMGQNVEHEIIYHRLLGLGKYSEKREQGELVPRAKIGKQSLYDEAQLLTLAGSDTVGNALTVGTFYVLSTPGVADKLLEELRTVWPGNPWENAVDASEDFIDGSEKLPVGWEMLEKLPYLGGVVRESLRLSHGATTPLARLAPAQGITVDGWTFPAGTGISSTSSFIDLDPLVFPDPHTFRPERWIGPNSAALERYLVVFSKGPRQCLGLNLAWCELYLAFATLYRRFEFELFDTKREDINYKDYGLPVFNGKVKVRVKTRND